MIKTLGAVTGRARPARAEEAVAPYVTFMSLQAVELARRASRNICMRRSGATVMCLERLMKTMTVREAVLPCRTHTLPRQDRRGGNQAIAAARSPRAALPDSAADAECDASRHPITMLWVRPTKRGFCRIFARIGLRMPVPSG